MLSCSYYSKIKTVSIENKIGVFFITLRHVRLMLIPHRLSEQSDNISFKGSALSRFHVAGNSKRS